ncbi:MAG: hypothetical protein Q9207_003616 [Kuettlingeria erythrocarpa]
MPRIMVMRSFEDSLIELEDLVKSCFKLYEIDAKTARFEALETRINREMEAMMQASPDDLRPDRYMRFFERITALRKDMSTFGSELHRFLGVMAFRAVMTLNDPLAVDGEDGDQDSDSWEIPVVSLKYESFRLPTKDCSHLPLKLGYNAEATTLYVKNHGALGDLANVEFDGMREPLVALATSGRQFGEVKLVPCPQDSDAQAASFEIVLESAKITQVLVERLVQMGCSVMQIPGK